MRLRSRAFPMSAFANAEGFRYPNLNSPQVVMWDGMQST